MKLEKIFNKYKIETIDYRKNNKEFKKLDSSKKITFIKKNYYIDLDKIDNEFTAEIMLTVDEVETYENLASLNIEGITSTKASSSKARDLVDKIDDVNENEVLPKKKSSFERIQELLQKMVFNQIDDYYSLLPEKKRPSKIDFMRNIGINLAVKYIEDKSSYNKIETQDIKIIYGLLTLLGETLEKGDKLGEDDLYRTGEVNITDGIKIIDKGIPAQDINEKMELLIKLMNQESEIETRTVASIIHFLFIEIHPYFDGNGRMSRLITKLISKNETSGGLWSKHMNKIIDWTKTQYYKSIQMTRQTNDLTYFVVYMDWVYNISYFSEQIIFEENQRLLGNSKKMSELKMQVIIYLLTFSNLYISWKDIQKNIVPAKDLSEQGIKKALNEMAADDLLIKQKADNNNVYKISDRISNDYNLVR